MSVIVASICKLHTSCNVTGELEDDEDVLENALERMPNGVSRLLISCHVSPSF